MAVKTEEELQREKQDLETQQQQAADDAAKKAEEEAQKQGLSDEDIQKLIEKARKEEKDKLYPKIEELTVTIKSLQDHVRQEQEEKERIKKEAEEAAERDRVAQLSAEERRDEILTKLEEQLNRERQAREEFSRQLDERDRADHLRRYRDKAIQNAGDEIIVELVSGSSEAEIDESIRKAKDRYVEIVKAEKERQGQKIKDDLSSTSPNTEALEEEELKKRGLTSYDEDRYLKDAEYRKSIQRELDSAVKAAYGR